MNRMQLMREATIVNSTCTTLVFVLTKTTYLYTVCVSGVCVV